MADANTDHHIDAAEGTQPAAPQPGPSSSSPPYSAVFSLRKLAYARLDPLDAYRYDRDVKNPVYRVGLHRCCVLGPRLRHLLYRKMRTWDSWTVQMRQLIRCATRYGHIECLQVAIPPPPVRPQRWHARFDCDAAAYHGQLDCMRFLHQRGFRLTRSTCSKAARGGHLACLQYARQHGCPWSATTCYAAARHGHLACLAWARGQGCPWDERTFVAAATGGHAECLAYAYLVGCPYDRVATIRRLEALLGGVDRANFGDVDDEDLPIMECLYLLHDMQDYVPAPAPAATTETGDADAEALRPGD